MLVRGIVRMVGSDDDLGEPGLHRLHGHRQRRPTGRPRGRPPPPPCVPEAIRSAQTPTIPTATSEHTFQMGEAPVKFL